MKYGIKMIRRRKEFRAMEFLGTFRKRREKRKEREMGQQAKKALPLTKYSTHV